MDSRLGKIVVCLVVVIAQANAQLTVLTLPEPLVSSSGNVVEGSVIQIYCIVEMDTNVTFTWTFNGSALLSNPPHIRIREDNRPERSLSLITDDSTSVLTVDNFRDTDNGVYQCTATDGSQNITGNGIAVTLTGVPSNLNGTLQLITQPSDTEHPAFNNPARSNLNDNRTGIRIGGNFPASLLTCTAGHHGDGVMNYSAPSVVWVRDGQVVVSDSRITITTTSTANGQVTTTLDLPNFQETDAGVYQCVFTDDSGSGEVITTIPHRADTSDTLRLERVSPEVIVLRPPKRLVIEVRASGNYEVLSWYKDVLGTKIPQEMLPQEFPNFFEMFVRVNTTANDKGLYIVQPEIKTQTQTVIPSGGLDFAVIASDDANTTSLSPDPVIIPEGGSADISCTSVGAPVPTITWVLNNQTTGFEQTDIETPFVATLTSSPGNRMVDLTPGNIESTLHIVSAMYPDHDGVYTCIGTNADDMSVASSSAFVTVQVHVLPDVEFIANDTLVNIGDDVTLEGSVTRGDPSYNNFSIIDNMSNILSISSIYTITNIQMINLGTYRCEVTNGAGTGEASVIIALGEPPMVTTVQPDPVVVDTSEDLTCVVTGDTPIVIVWERLYSNGSVQVVFTGNDTTGGNFTVNVSGDDYGMYRCSGTSRFGSDSSTINIEQAVGPTLSMDEYVEAVTNTPLTLTGNITHFNLPLTEIIWARNGTTLTESTDRVTITHTSTDFPPTTSTFTLDPVLLLHEGGQYSVTVVNPAGNDTTLFNVTVTSPPVIIFPSETVDLAITEGDEAILICTARGTPAPEFVWYRGGVLITSNDSLLQTEMLNETTGFTYVTSQLNVSTDRSDFGMQFMCVASNFVLRGPANDSQTYNLSVNFPPSIIEDPVRVAVFAPDAATVMCTANGFPVPTISWIKRVNGTEEMLSSSAENLVIIEQVDGFNRTSTLTVQPSSTSDTANYSCRAVNDVGNSTSNQAEIIVYVGAQAISPACGNVFTVNETENINVECVGTGLSAPMISFLSEEGQDLQFTHRVTVNEMDPILLSDGTYEVTVVMTLTDAMDIDSGNFSCQVVNTVAELNQTREDEVNLVLVVNVAPTVTQSPVDLTIIEDYNATFECQADAVPRPDITWEYYDPVNMMAMPVDTNGAQSAVANTTDGDRLLNSTLTIFNVEPMDFGTYRCMATNVVGMNNESATLTIHVPPIITETDPPELLVINQTDTATFSCIAMGIPTPLIQWYRGGLLLNGNGIGINSRLTLDNPVNDHSLGEVGVAMSKLSISDTVSNDSGIYTCIATNDLINGAKMEDGRDEASITLFVQVLPEVVPLMPGQRIVANESESTTLMFRIDNADPLVNTSNIRWFYTATLAPSLFADGHVFQDITLLTTQTRGSTLTLSADRLMLTINNIVQARTAYEETDSGRYFLQATNEAGVHSSYIDVVVFGPPVIHNPPAHQLKIVGFSAVFSCGAIASPQHTVSWTFTNSSGDTVELASNSKYTIVSNNSDTLFGQLTVMNVEYGDRGVYTCTAENIVGAVSTKANLTVQGAPHIVDSSGLTEVNASLPAVLVCLATGFPVPSISWRKNSKEFNIDNDIFLMQRLDIITAKYIPASNQSDNNGFLSTRYTGNGSIVDLLMDTDVTVNKVLELGELGVVGLLLLNETLRTDTANYTCTATNMLPQTTILMDVSSNIPLVILERPDPPIDVTAFMNGARWVAVRWTPSFDGNRLVITFSLYYRTDESDNFTLISSLNATDFMTSEGRFMYNISNGLILPFTNYSLVVVSCNEIGCSEQSDPSPVVRTDQDASSPPLQPVGNPYQNEIMLTWTQPVMPNGIITDYRVSYLGSRAFDSDFEHTDSLILALADLATPSAGQFQTNITGLFSNTIYDITVVAVNGVGDGNPVNLVVSTDNVPPVNKPSIADAVIANPRTVTITTVEFSEANGPISHFQIIVVCLPQGTEIGDLQDPGTEFPQNVLQTHADISCDNLPNTPLAYISAEMSSDLYRGLPSGLFVVGQSVDDDPNSPNDRPALYTNGPLCFSTEYTFIIRGFSGTVSQVRRRSTRQADNRQYNLFESSDYVPSVSIGCGAIFLVQFRLVGVQSCLQWVDNNGRGRLDTLSEALIDNIESRCQCGFSVVNLNEPRFRCYPESTDAVTYRVQICSSFSQTVIVSHIEEWLMQGALVAFEFILIPIDASCPIVISSIQDPECAKQVDFETNSLSVPALLGGVIGGIAVILIALGLVIVIFTFWKRRNQRTFEISKTRSQLDLGQVQNAEYEELDDFRAEPLHTQPTDDAYDEVQYPPALPSSPPPSVSHAHSPTAEYVAISQQAAPDIDCAENAAYAVSTRL